MGRYTKALANSVKENKTLTTFDGLMYIVGSIPMFIITIGLLFVNALIYLGDGMTDVPCMVLVKSKGGKSIAIHQRKDKDTMINLMKEGRVNFACLADYSEDSDLDKTIKMIINRVSTEHDLVMKEESQVKKIVEQNK